jgi:hypothetical protein
MKIHEYIKTKNELGIIIYEKRRASIMEMVMKMLFNQYPKSQSAKKKVIICQKCRCPKTEKNGCNHKAPKKELFHP